MIKILIENKIQYYTAGYILDDGDIYYLNEYHGEDTDNYRDLHLPEFSSTHPEEDTCVRLYQEPNNEQYNTLETIFDTFLDESSYCKIEINNDFYEVYELYEDACQDIIDTTNINIGNWTAYDLIRIIKNYFRNR